MQLHGDDYQEELLEHVDQDQLPEFLGGTCQAQLIDNYGPWNDYEIVDGHEKGDIVGVRKSGEEEIFTLQDWQKLPNMIVDGANLKVTAAKNSDFTSTQR